VLNIISVDGKHLHQDLYSTNFQYEKRNGTWLFIQTNVASCLSPEIKISCISAISWQPVLVVEEVGVPKENHRPWASNW
jgi:hypothetical protein